MTPPTPRDDAQRLVSNARDELNAHADLTAAPDATPFEVTLPPISPAEHPALAEAIDLLASTGSEPLTLEQRRRLSDRIERALADRRRDHGLLQPILRNRREVTAIPLDTLAAQLNMSTDSVRRTENGEIRIVDVAPETAGRWARLVDVPRDIAVDAYRRSLTATRTDLDRAAAAAAAETTTRTDDDQLIDAFTRAYDAPLEDA